VSTGASPHPVSDSGLVARYMLKKPNPQERIKHLFSFTKGNKKLMIGGFMLLFIIVVALCAPLIAPYTYNEMRTGKSLLESPSWEHPFGTDNFGRDVFSRVVYGTRISLGVAILCVGLGTIVGVPIGMVAGYLGGWFDILIMRLSDVMMTIPTILMAVTITAIMGSGLKVVIFALALVYMPGAARLARSMVYSTKEREYVVAAKVIGEPQHRILWRYIFPNCIGPIVVQFTLRLSSAVLAEAGISYLGYGTQPPMPSWGLMLSDSQGYMWQAPILCIFPGLAILVLVLAGNLFGDGLRDLLDPRFKGRFV